MIDTNAQAAERLGPADRAATLHPFTPLRAFEAGEMGEPRFITGGSGVKIQDANGKELIDGFAGLYCVNVGYGRKEVAEAIAKQAYELAYYHTYAGHSNLPLAQLSERLIKAAPGKMSKVFYGASGSDANDTQVKMVWYMNNALGRPQKKKIISRLKGYHGVTVASASLTGLPNNHDRLRPAAAGHPAHLLPASLPLRGAGRERAGFLVAPLAAELEDMILREGPDTVAAFIAEPVMGAGGAILPPDG
jgi:L-2,4-diaminobutyrate transaminase